MFADLGRLNMPDISRESSGVEYHPPVQLNRDLSKKVRVVSAPKEDRRKQQPRATAAAASRPSKQTAGQRPIWGYRNPEHKRPIKQSERDAFHSSDARRQRRIERQNELLQMMARNSEIVPDYRTIVTNRARSRSHENRSDDLPAHSGRGPGSERNRHNRSYSRSPEPLPSLPPPSRAILSSHVPSPAVPSVRHQPDGKRDVNRYHDPLVMGNSNTNFVPFIRSSNVLNPAHAESPVPFSREASEIEKARRAYQGVLNPAKYGHKLDFDANGAELSSRRKVGNMK